MKSLHAILPLRSLASCAATAKARGLSLSMAMGLAVLLGAVGGAGAGTGAKPQPAPQVFLRAMDDVPLMAGLIERPAEGVDFESAAGRIVEAAAESAPAARLTTSRVMGFYKATLAALGWRALGGGRFTREDEILTIVARTEGEGLRVRFSLRPK